MATAKPKLEDQGKLVFGRFPYLQLMLRAPAATAALYVTRPDKHGKKDTQPKGNYPLDEDNRLSSAGELSFYRFA